MSPTAADDRIAYDPNAFNGDVAVYRISGAFFFGATAAVSGVLDRIGAHPKTFILDFAEVPLVDSTAAKRARRLRAQAAALRHEDLLQRHEQHRGTGADQRRTKASGRALQRQRGERAGGRARGLNLTRPILARPAG